MSIYDKKGSQIAVYHAEFADAVMSFFQELCALLKFHELDHLVWRQADGFRSCGIVG